MPDASCGHLVRTCRLESLHDRQAGMPELWSRFPNPCEFELGTAQVLEHELVVRKVHQVNCCRERRLDFESVLIAELISAANFSDEHGAVTENSHTV